jgi:hypothetical protein
MSCKVDENCALPGHYTANCGNFVQTFRDNVSVHSSESLFLDSLRWKERPLG